MKRAVMIVLTLALLSLLTPRASLAAASSSTKKYNAEHRARLNRHHTLTLANPADYIRPTDKAIELRLVATAVDGKTGAPGDALLLGSGGHTLPSRPGGAPGTGSQPAPAKFHLWIDQLRMNVDYP